MNSRKRRGLLLVLLGVIVVWFQVIFYCPPMTGRVVDMKGRPIAGTVVVADWSVHAAFSNAPIGQVKMFEVVTDADGRFRIPAWGLEAVVDGTVQGPVVRIFHPDFAPLILDNGPKGGIGFLIPTFRHNGETFVLTANSSEGARPGAGFPELYRSLFGPGRNVTIGGNCPKLTMPRMLAAMEKAPGNIINGDIPGSPVIAFRASDVENRVPCHYDGSSAAQLIR